MGAVTQERSQLADDLLREAFERRYRFAPGFPGFGAQITFGTPQEQYRGEVDLRGAGEVTLYSAAPDAESAWALQELRALSRLSFGHDYERGEGRFHKSLVVESHELGPLIVLHGDPHEATFRVRDAKVLLMTRRQGGLVELVRVEHHHRLDDGQFAPARWVTELWDENQPDALRVERHWDLRKHVGGELLPMLHRVDCLAPEGGPQRQIELRGWTVDGVPLDPDGPAGSDFSR